jgi:hypothetical protein
VFALAAQAGEVKLIVVELAADWSSATMRPWPSDEEAADVAAISTGRIAVVTERDRRSVLHLIERANLTHSRTLGVPCVAPQIVGHSEDHVWLTGMSPSDAASGRSRAASVPRCDLFRCELRTGRVIVETAELDCTVIDVAVAVGGGRALLVSQRGAYVVSDDYTGIREVVELCGDDEVTGIACGRGPAVFVRGQRGPRLVVGNDRTVVTLASPGHSPLVVRAARMDKRG